MLPWLIRQLDCLHPKHVIKIGGKDYVLYTSSPFTMIGHFYNESDLLGWSPTLPVSGRTGKQSAANLDKISAAQNKCLNVFKFYSEVSPSHRRI